MDTLSEFKKHAREQGMRLRLTPFPATVLDTARQVAGGYDTSAKLAQKLGLSLTVASERLRQAMFDGLLRRSRPPGPGGYVYRVTGEDDE